MESPDSSLGQPAIVDLRGKVPVTIPKSMYESVFPRGVPVFHSSECLSKAVRSEVFEDPLSEIAWRIIGQLSDLFAFGEIDYYLPVDSLDRSVAAALGREILNLAYGLGETVDKEAGNEVLEEAILGLSCFIIQFLEKNKNSWVSASDIDAREIMRKILGLGFNRDGYSDIELRELIDRANSKIPRPHNEETLSNSRSGGPEEMLPLEDAAQGLKAALELMELIRDPERGFVALLAQSPQIIPESKHIELVKDIALAQMGVDINSDIIDPNFELLNQVFKQILDELKFKLGNQYSTRAYIRFFKEWIDSCLERIHNGELNEELAAFIRNISETVKSDFEALNTPANVLDILNEASFEHIIPVEGERFILGDGFADFLLEYMRYNKVDMGPILPTKNDYKDSFYRSLSRVLNSFCNIMAGNGNEPNEHIFDNLIRHLEEARLSEEDSGAIKNIDSLIGALMLIKQMRIMQKGNSDN